MKHLILNLFVMLFAVTSCKKNNEMPVTIIEGKVINTGSKEPIEKVKVIVTDGIGGNSILPSGNTSGTGKEYVTYTNSYGNFSIKTEGEAPFLSLEKDGYRFVVMKEGAGMSVKEYLPGKEYKEEILELWADAFFKPIFVKKDCIPSDSTYIDEGSNIPIGFKKTTFLFQGCTPIDRWSIKGTKGIGDAYFHYWIKYQIKGEWHEKVDSVYLKSFTTYTDTIYY